MNSVLAGAIGVTVAMKSTEASNNTRSLKQAIQTPRPTLISMLQCLTFAIFLAPEQFTRAKVADKKQNWSFKVYPQ